MLFRGAGGWAPLNPGTAGQVLTTGGPSSDPHWVAASAAALAGLSDVTLTSPADQDQLTYIASASKWQNKTISSVLDAVLGTTQGSIIYRGASAWAALGPGTSGQVLQSGGASANPAWATSSAQPKYNIGCYVPNVLTANQNLLFHKFTKAVTVPANFGSYSGHVSEAGSGVAATASTAIDVAKAVAATPTTFSTVGTITFAAAAASATFASTGGTAITFAQGDVTRLRGPASPDATLADFFATIAGYET
jgi:hypothetical protein